MYKKIIETTHTQFIQSTALAKTLNSRVIDSLLQQVIADCFPFAKTRSQAIMKSNACADCRSEIWLSSFYAFRVYFLVLIITKSFAISLWRSCFDFFMTYSEKFGNFFWSYRDVVSNVWNYGILSVCFNIGTVCKNLSIGWITFENKWKL